MIVNVEVQDVSIVYVQHMLNCVIQLFRVQLYLYYQMNTIVIYQSKYIYIYIQLEKRKIGVTILLYVHRSMTDVC
jgi:hypothetical protein